VTNILLITHGTVGEAMLAMMIETLGQFPLPVKCLAVKAGDEPAELLAQARVMVDEFNGGDVIVLTDLFGSTPSNIASQLIKENAGMAMIAGVNIPMLIRMLNYADESTAVILDKAVSGGRDGILAYVPGRDD